MTGKLIGIFIVAVAIIAGVALYYFQVYAYYDSVTEDEVALTGIVSGAPETILFEDFQAIDSTSSPIRYRACFTTPMSLSMLSETYTAYDAAEPRVAPGWFDCFDADAIGADLATGEALAFLGTANIQYGIDRVVAIYPDGRGYAWHQINRCGEVVFEGEPAPEGCPPPPERIQ